jgi:hypothetical protein
MPRVSPIKQSFNAGVFSRLLDGRVDHAKFPLSLRTGKNLIGVVQGPAMRRSGTRMMQPVHNEGKVSALVPFVFTNEQALTLEFADLKVRFHSDAGTLTLAASAITAIVTASPFVFTSAALTAAGGAIGKQVALSGFAVNQSLDGVICNITGKTGDNYTVTIPGGGAYTGPTGAVVGHTAALVYEVASPYAEADVRNIVALQDVDVMYLFCKGYRPRTLSRLGATNWVFATRSFIDGPFAPEDTAAPILDPNNDGIATADHTSGTSSTGTASGTTATGAGTIAWKAFDSSYNTYWEPDTDQTGHLEYQFATPTVIEGYAMYIPEDNDEVDADGVAYSQRDHAPATWKFYGSADGISFVLLDEVYDYTAWTNFRTPYRKLNNTVAYEYYRLDIRNIVLPGNKIHPRLARLVMRQAGDVTFDLTASSVSGINKGAGFQTTDVGRLLRVYQPDGYWRSLEITARTSTTVITAKLQGEPLYSGAKLRRWRMGYYSDTTGWPYTAAWFEARMAMGGCTEFPNLIAFSAPEQYDVMSPSDPDGLTVPTNGIALRPIRRRASPIQWIVGDEKALLIGTESDEFVIGPATEQEAFSATNAKYRPSTKRGSAFIQPVEIDRQVLFVQSHRKVVREFAYAYQDDGFKAPSMSVFASHMGVSRFAQVAYAQEPHSIVWIRRDDGSLCSLVYSREENVVGWYEHDIGGVVESMCALPSVSDEQDTLWLTVRRTIDGNTRRYIERLAPMWDFGMTHHDARFADCWARIELGGDTTQAYGLRFLEGETVVGLMDGKKFTAVVTDGGVELPDTASDYVFVGKAFETLGEAQRFDAGAADGTAVGKLQRTHALGVLLWDSAGGQLGQYNDDQKAIEWQDVNYGNHGATLPDEVELYSGVMVPTELEGQHGFNNTLHWRTSDVFPFNVVALMPRMETQDGG